ncbi:MAG: ATP-dependent Clp protease adaptor protein ClpS, partial [Actinomycetota bacterium]|nr:ATP-dependent Clp protease adaptor protein ClpS [Actinomycetota bacterium]
MERMSTPVASEQTQVDPLGVEVTAEDKPWRTVVWNDPVNLMSYV